MKIHSLDGYFKLWLQNGLTWQCHEFSLDVGVKLFYTDSASIELLVLLIYQPIHQKEKIFVFF